MRAQLCLTFCDPMDCSLPGSVRGILQARMLECCHFLLQEIFPTQRLKPGLLHWEADSLPLSHLGSPDSFIQFSSFAQSRLTLCNSMDCGTPASLFVTNSWSLLQLMSIESVMPSNHLILSCFLLLLPSIFPSIRVFSNESVLHIRWPEYWSFSFSISPSSEYWGLISFRMDWLDLLAVPGTLKSLLQHNSSKASVFWHSASFSYEIVISDFF